MTTTAEQNFTLSANTRHEVAELMETVSQKSKETASKDGLWCLGAGAVTTALALAFPPSLLLNITLAAFGIVAALKGASAVGHFANGKFMDKAKKETGEDSFFEKLQNRVARLGKIRERTNKMADVLLYTGSASALVSVLFPPAAPVAWPIFVTSMVVSAAGRLTNFASGLCHTSAGKIEDAAIWIEQVETAALMTSRLPEASAVSTLSLSPGFDKAVNGNTPPEPDTAQPEAQLKIVPGPKN